MKICVIGNSHVAALKLAWDGFQQDIISAGGFADQQPELTFFAERGTGMADLIIEQDKLVPVTPRLKESLRLTSNGLSAIEPAQFDVILVYGLEASVLKITKSSRYSAAFLARAMQQHVDSQLSFQVVRQLRQISDKKIYVGHNPLKRGKATAKDIGAKAYLNNLNNMNAQIYQPLQAELLAQPLATIVDQWFTTEQYAVGSKRLAIGAVNDHELHPNDDNQHMNEQFGRLWLIDFFRHLQQQMKQPT